MRIPSNIKASAQAIFDSLHDDVCDIYRVSSNDDIFGNKLPVLYQSNVKCQLSATRPKQAAQGLANELNLLYKVYFNPSIGVIEGDTLKLMHKDKQLEITVGEVYTYNINKVCAVKEMKYV